MRKRGKRHGRFERPRGSRRMVSAGGVQRKGRSVGLKKWQKALLLVGGSMACLVLLLAAAWKIFAKPLDVKQEPGKTVKVVQTDPDTGREIVEEVPVSRVKGVFNILLAGTDDDGGRTDTIMVAHLDTRDHSVALVSVPRDSIVLTQSESIAKINSLYGRGGKGEEGMEYLSQRLGEMLGFPIDGYVLVDLEAFKAAVDLVGGVYFDVPQDMDYEDSSQDLYIHLKAGYQLLDGEKAMELCRFRKYPAADIQRTKVQQDFMRALAHRCASFASLTKIDEFIQIFHDYVTTDLKVSNMAYFCEQLLQCNFDEMQTFTLPGEGVYIDGGAYYALYADDVLEIVNQALNPYDYGLTQENMNVYVMGGVAASGGETVSGRTESARSGSSGSSSAAGGSSGEDTPATRPSETTEPPESTVAEATAPPEFSAPPESTENTDSGENTTSFETTQSTEGADPSLIP